MSEPEEMVVGVNASRRVRRASCSAGCAEWSGSSWRCRAEKRGESSCSRAAVEGGGSGSSVLALGIVCWLEEAGAVEQKWAITAFASEVVCNCAWAQGGGARSTNRWGPRGIVCGCG
jgi:hypothetical protein